MSAEMSLPEGWIKTDLGSVAQWGSGGTPSRNNSEYYGGTIPWVKTGDLGPKIIKTVDEYITEEAVKNSSAKFFPKNSVVIAMYGATIGKTSILGIDATTNQACAVAIPQSEITSTAFLYYLLRSEKDNFIAKGKGGAQPNISQSLIKEHEISIPPLAEQHQIAQRLDELLAQVDTIKARLDAIPNILKRFRQSVLSAAVSGKLTEQWRKLNSQEFWQECELKLLDISLQIGPFGSLLHKSDYIEDGVPLINPMHINNGRIYPSSHMTISHEKALELKRYGLNVGDVILGRRGEMGRAAVVYNQNYICGTGSLFLRPNAEKFNSNFICLFFRSPQTIKKLEADAVGSTMVNLNQKVLQGLIFPNISIIEQTEIVRRVDHLFTFAEQIEQRVNDAKTRVDKLTQSILAKAFRGELTADWRAEHPELISGENSAEALLAKIQAAKAALEGKKKKGKAA